MAHLPDCSVSNDILLLLDQGFKRFSDMYCRIAIKVLVFAVLTELARLKKNIRWVRLEVDVL